LLIILTKEAFRATTTNCISKCFLFCICAHVKFGCAYTNMNIWLQVTSLKGR